MFAPRRSAGIRSGVNWMRRKRQPSSRASASDSSVLPVPGAPSSSMWPPATSEAMASIFTRSWPMMTRSSSCRSAVNRDATSAMVCMWASSGRALQRAERVVDRVELAVERMCGDFFAGARRQTVREIGDPLVQRVAAQTRLRGDRALERCAVERDRVSVRDGAAVQRAERCDEIDGVRSRVALLGVSRSDAPRVAPEREHRCDAAEDEQRTETPFRHDRERSVVGRDAVCEFVEVDRAAVVSERREKREVMTGSEVAVLEHLRNADDDHVAGTDWLTRDDGFTVAGENRVHRARQRARCEAEMLGQRERVEAGPDRKHFRRDFAGVVAHLDRASEIVAGQNEAPAATRELFVRRRQEKPRGLRFLVATFVVFVIEIVEIRIDAEDDRVPWNG